MRARVRLVAMVVAVAEFGLTGSAHAQATGGACTATLASKRPVRMPDGASVFVEPQAVATSGLRILIAGNPTYLFHTEQDRITGVARDSIFGVVMTRDARASAIPSPLPAGRVHAVRAAPYENGHWAVVFAEAPPRAKFSAPIKAEAYWFGVTDGTRWLRMERLPAVEGTLIPDDASELVRTVRGYAFAVPVTTATGGRAAVFSERGGQWTVQLVTDGATYLSLATDGREFMLAAVTADTVGRDPSKPSSDNNSLLLYRSTEQGTKWASRVRLIRGWGQPVHHPRLVWTGQRLELGWMAHHGITGETRIGALNGADSIVFWNAMAEGTQHITSTTAPNGRPFWVTMDVDSFAAATQSLHVWTITGAKASQLIGERTTFDGVVGFSILGSAVMVVGPVRGDGPSDPPVALHLHTFTMHCD